MLDINLFREDKGHNPEIIRESQRHRFADVDLVDQVILLDKEWRQRTLLHHASKERKRKAIRFFIRNGAFLPDDIHYTMLNPPLHYCPGLGRAYKELRLLQLQSSSSAEASNSSKI